MVWSIQRISASLTRWIADFKAVPKGHQWGSGKKPAGDWGELEEWETLHVHAPQRFKIHLGLRVVVGNDAPATSTSLFAVQLPIHRGGQLGLWRLQRLQLLSL